jgi:hypothetical protein
MYGHKKLPRIVTSRKLHMPGSSVSIKYLCYYRLMTDTPLNIKCQNTISKGTQATESMFLETGLLYLRT